MCVLPISLFLAFILFGSDGHGAIPTALHLADSCGANAFAVATLEEGIALRKAFAENPPGRWKPEVATVLQTAVTTQWAKKHDGNEQMDSMNESFVSTIPQQQQQQLTTQQHVAAARCRRPAQIRILVLGPPVGFPQCFNEYYHHGIEVMVSGPEVATAIGQWVENAPERHRAAVERAAAATKEAALLLHPPPLLQQQQSSFLEEKKDEAAASPQNTAAESATAEAAAVVPKKVLPHPCSTLGNMQGRDLAKEVRLMLMNQKAASDQAASEAASSRRTSPTPSDDGCDVITAPAVPSANNSNKQTFGGIEAVAKHSRVREMAANNSNNASKTTTTTPVNRKRLRWHALVDSGMGRLGFRTEIPGHEARRDTVDLLQELVNAEIYQNAPIEFYGMCTHMADANATSTFTGQQIDKFTALLQRVRAAGISVPTVSTDNSAALLTTSLTHFDPATLLTQQNAHTRGYVRTGGAIYGQRPAFTELQPPSTLVASVRHVAVLQRGDSVGYDRAYVAAYDVRIATLTIGFADGYPRELGNGVGKVAIRGQIYPVAGNVCMDMLMVELGPAEEESGVVVGDTAVLWGPIKEHGSSEPEERVRLQDVAATLKTTQSALTCGLNKTRVARLYI